MTTAERIARARTRLLLDFPWFGALSMRLKLQPGNCPTFRTDGTVIEYSPAFADTLTDAEITGVLAHEVMHCAMLHCFRRGSRDSETWNRACDAVINPQLIAAKLTLPSGCVNIPDVAGLSAERVYAKLQAEKQNPPPQQGGKGKPQTGKSGKPASSGAQSLGNGSPAPCPTGTVEDAPKPATTQPGDKPGEPQPMTETDWKIAAEQASRVASAAGKLPGGADRAVKQARESQMDWRETLRRFIEQTNPVDYSWSQPNRRYIAQGLYLPGTTKENLGYFVVAIDTSGSVNQSMLDVVGAELTAIMQEARPERLQVVYCDTAIRSTEVFTPDDGEVKLHAKGGGGTRFSPVFDWVDTQCLDSDAPKALLYFTDLECSDRPAEPSAYPVLWITPACVTRRAPWGEQVPLLEVDR